MLKTFAALTLSLLVPVAVLAQAPATLPTTQPGAVDAKVLIVPFTPVEASDPDWIGRAVQQSLLADLSRGGGSHSVQPIGDTARIGSVAEAMDAGKKAGVRYVIFGSYQRIEPNLRITGQVVDVTTGKVVAGLKSTGSERNLFEMQDTLAFQAKWGLGTERLAEKSAAKPADAPAPTIQPQGPVATAGERYAESDLSRAVADGRSLIERKDAAGRSYRDNYYDDTPSYPVGYAGAGYYGGYYGYPYYRDPYASWWWGRRVVIIGGHGHHCDHRCNHDKRPGRTHFTGPVPTVGSRDYSIGVGNTMGSYRMTMQGAERNYIGPTPGPSRTSSASDRVSTPGRIGSPAPAAPRPVRHPMTPVKTAK